MKSKAKGRRFQTFCNLLTMFRVATNLLKFHNFFRNNISHEILLDDLSHWWVELLNMRSFNVALVKASGFYRHQMKTYSNTLKLYTLTESSLLVWRHSNRLALCKYVWSIGLIRKFYPHAPKIKPTQLIRDQHWKILFSFTLGSHNRLHISMQHTRKSTTGKYCSEAFAWKPCFSVSSTGSRRSIALPRRM